ncbi:hypothetical protein ES703_76762 [subsurface metagenome]
MEAEVFPVEAQATFLKPIILATVIPVVIPLSLKDAVGFSPSCFSHRCLTPTHSPTFSAEYRLVFPSGRETMNLLSISNISSLYLQTPEL